MANRVIHSGIETKETDYWHNGVSPAINDNNLNDIERAINDTWNSISQIEASTASKEDLNQFKSVLDYEAGIDDDPLGKYSDSKYTILGQKLAKLLTLITATYSDASNPPVDADVKINGKRILTTDDISEGRSFQLTGYANGSILNLVGSDAKTNCFSIQLASVNTRNIKINIKGGINDYDINLSDIIFDPDEEPNYDYLDCSVQRNANGFLIINVDLYDKYGLNYRHVRHIDLNSFGSEIETITVAPSSLACQIFAYTDKLETSTTINIDDFSSSLFSFN